MFEETEEARTTKQYTIFRALEGMVSKKLTISTKNLSWNAFVLNENNVKK